MQFLPTINEFSFFGIFDPGRIFNCLALKTVFKEYFISNFKDFQTTAPFYLK